MTCGGLPSYHAGHAAVPICVVPEDHLAGEVSHQQGVQGAQGTEAWAARHGGRRTASRSHCQAPSEPASPSRCARTVNSVNNVPHYEREVIIRLIRLQRPAIRPAIIAGQAANCRRVEPQSRSPTHLAIDYRCHHLALESAERRRPAKVEVAIEGTCRTCDPEVDCKNLKNAGHNTAILATNPAKEELAESSHLFRHDCHDVRHLSPLPENWTTGAALPHNG